MSSSNMKNSNVAKVIGHYEIQQAIGQGTFGKVRLGKHIVTQQSVAIKILEKKKIGDVSDIERVAREIHILKLIRHPNIIQLYEIIETPKKLYLIMEHASGGELFEYIVSNNRLNEQEACQYFHHILAGIEYAHQLGIVHRDFKPENLLFNAQKQIQIVDFGLSNTYKPGELLKTACGSPWYAAPEMIAGQRYKPIMVDIWSWGVTLFAMLSGFLPFEDKNTRKLYKKILNCTYEEPHHLSVNARDLIRRILNTDPEKRYNIEQIRAHPWCELASYTIPRGIFVGNGHVQVNLAVLERMEKYGFNKEYVKHWLEANEHSHTTATYYLTCKKLNTWGKSRPPKLTHDSFHCPEFAKRPSNSRLNKTMHSSSPRPPVPTTPMDSLNVTMRLQHRKFLDRTIQRRHSRADTSKIGSRATPVGGLSKLMSPKLGNTFSPRALTRSISPAHARARESTNRRKRNISLKPRPPTATSPTKTRGASRRRLSRYKPPISLIEKENVFQSNIQEYKMDIYFPREHDKRDFQSIGIDMHAYKRRNDQYSVNLRTKDRERKHQQQRDRNEEEPMVMVPVDGYLLSIIPDLSNANDEQKLGMIVTYLQNSGVDGPEVDHVVDYLKKCLAQPTALITQICERVDLTDLLMAYLTSESCLEIQKNAAWALRNVHNAKKKEKLENFVYYGGMERVMQFMITVEDVSLLVDLTMILFETIDRQQTFAQHAVSLNFHKLLLDQTSQSTNFEVQTTGILSLRNLIQQEALISDHQILVLNIAANLLCLSQIPDLMTKMCLETISEVLKRNIEQIPPDTYLPILPPVVRELTYSENDSLIQSALNLMNQIICGEEKDVQNVLEAGILDVYERHLNHESQKIRWYIFNGLSNIAAQSSTWAEAIMNHSMFPQLNDGMNMEFDIKYEFSFYLKNLWIMATEDQVQKITDHGFLCNLAACMQSGNDEMQYNLMCWVYCMLLVTQIHFHKFRNELEAAGVLEVVLNNSRHLNERISTLAESIISIDDSY